MRRAIVVDSASPTKIPRLLRSLVGAGLLPAQTGSQTQPVDGAIALVVATHPHRDHIGGISQLLTGFAGAVSEMWEPGYYHTGPDYIEMMNAIESQASLLYAQPTSGLRRWFGNVAVTVLTPSIQLRNRFDTYGVEVNNASISLRVEFPATRVVQRADDRSLLDTPNTKSLILGADAQTLSWSYADTDFPVLAASDTAAAKAIKAATGSDPFRSQVLKVSHHASKHGVNLELVERIKPALTLVSSVAGGGSYRFPHTVTPGADPRGDRPDDDERRRASPRLGARDLLHVRHLDGGREARLVRGGRRRRPADDLAHARLDHRRDRPVEGDALDRLSRALSARAATTRPSRPGCATRPCASARWARCRPRTSRRRGGRSASRPMCRRTIAHAGLAAVRRTRRGAVMRRPPPAWSTIS